MNDINYDITDLILKFKHDNNKYPTYLILNNKEYSKLATIFREPNIFKHLDKRDLLFNDSTRFIKYIATNGIKLDIIIHSFYNEKTRVI